MLDSPSKESALQWSACGICHIGKIRGNNEDNLLFCGRVREELAMPIWEGNFSNGKKNTIFAVMDGMGGESHGEWASLITAVGLQQLESHQVAEISSRLLQINQKICQKIQLSGAHRIGSTVVVARVANACIDFINIGDSRGYLWQSGILTQLTYDHTEWQSKLSMGFTEEDLKKSKTSQSALTQHLGIFPDELILEPYTATVQVSHGDKLLLCSDGLSGMVSHQEMVEIFEKNRPPKQTTHELLALALENGGRDNITIEVVGFYNQKENKGEKMG